jgi:divalent metal cation (Fe/Co/Zn/Cd) transporter
MYRGPEEILLNIEISFRDHLSTAEIVRAIVRLESQIGQQHRDVQRIFIKRDR